MKTKISVVSVMMLVVCLMPLKNSGQEISTNGEIYVFNIGDVFHYENYFYGAFYKKIHTITGKYYSANYDTLYYPYEIEWAVRYGWEDTTWSYGSGTDLLSYSDLDSLVNNGEIDFVYSEPLMYNGRLVNEHFCGKCEQLSFVVGCGKAEDSYSEEYTDELLWSNSLVYYKKGVEEWGNPIEFYTGMNQLNDISEIKVYPNPASDYINIDFKESDLLVKEAIIYNHFGQKVLEAVPVNNTVDVSKLKPGIYFIEVATKEWRGRTKFVKQ